MTSMDVWMLVCMLFVASAQFEYAVQLKIRFGKRNKIGSGGQKEERCRKIDRHALFIFMGTYIVIVGAYFYNLYSKY